MSIDWKLAVSVCKYIFNKQRFRHPFQLPTLPKHDALYHFIRVLCLINIALK